MATDTTSTKYEHLKHTYRADISIDGTLLELDAFIGLHETFDYMDSMFPLRILLVNMRASVIKAIAFMNSNYCKIDLTLYQIEKSDEEIEKNSENYVHNEYQLYTVSYDHCIVDQELMPLSDEEVSAANEKNSENEIKYMVRFHLGNKYEYPFTAGLFNAVVNEACSPANIVTAAFLDCADEALKLYIDTPEEGSKVPAGAIFKPMGFLQVLDELETYGMYKLGHTVFIDDYTVYVLSKDGGIPDDDTPEIDYIIDVLNPMSISSRSNRGTRSGSGNYIKIPSDKIIVNDAMNVYYTNEVTRIASDGTVVKPNTSYKNVSHFVDNAKYVDPTIKRFDKDIRMQNVSIVCEHTYFDAWATAVFQVESSFYTLKNLTMRSMKRFVTPMGCITNLLLMRKLYDS